jgi:hypothetical protein
MLITLSCLNSGINGLACAQRCRDGGVNECVGDAERILEYSKQQECRMWWYNLGMSGEGTEALPVYSQNLGAGSSISFPAVW